MKILATFYKKCVHKIEQMRKKELRATKGLASWLLDE
jgi:hypothetical protein